jgi:chromosome segregation ATPase
MPQSLIKSQAS